MKWKGLFECSAADPAANNVSSDCWFHSMEITNCGRLYIESVESHMVRSPAILFPVLTEAAWRLGAIDINTDIAFVRRMRRKIEKALMLDVGR